jgi:mono/diheme cytochrome c family protein
VQQLFTRDKLFWRTLSSLPSFYPALGRVVVLMLMLASISLSAQNHNPFAGDPKAAKAGEFQFRINCAFCHGLGARGGGRGPDLTRSQKRHGNSDVDLFRTINQGIPGTAMPPNAHENATRYAGRRHRVSDFRRAYEFLGCARS